MNIDEDTTQHTVGEATRDYGTYRIGEQRRRDMSAHTRKSNTIPLTLLYTSTRVSI